MKTLKQFKISLSLLVFFWTIIIFRLFVPINNIFDIILVIVGSILFLAGILFNCFDLWDFKSDENSNLFYFLLLMNLAGGLIFQKKYNPFNIRVALILALIIFFIALYYISKGFYRNINTKMSKGIWNLNLKQVKWLLDKGENVNELDNKGTPPLLQALFGNNIGIVNLLIERGADVNLAYGKYTPLMDVSSAHKNIKIVILLLDKGANINAQDDRGYTALMYATKNDHKEIVKILLEKGADINLKNNDGKTVLDIENEKNETIKDVLVKYQTTQAKAEVIK